MKSIIVFSNLKPVVAGNFVLETVGDLESQPAFTGVGCLFAGLARPTVLIILVVIFTYLHWGFRVSKPCFSQKAGLEGDADGVLNSIYESHVPRYEEECILGNT